MPNDAAKSQIRIDLVLEEKLISAWYALYDRIFLDKYDKEPECLIRENARIGKSCVFFPNANLYFIVRNDRRIGILLASVHPRIREIAYVPYGGILPEERLTKKDLAVISTQLENHLLRKSTKIILVDCEDPRRSAILSTQYPKKQSENALRLYTSARLKLFANNHYFFIADPTTQYVRPGSNEPDTFVQRYDLLGFKILAEPEDFFCSKVLGIRPMRDGTGYFIHADGYRYLYTALHSLDSYSRSIFMFLFTILPGLQAWWLARKFDGCNEFFEALDRHPRGQPFQAFGKAHLNVLKGTAQYPESLVPRDLYVMPLWCYRVVFGHKLVAKLMPWVLRLTGKNPS